MFSDQRMMTVRGNDFDSVVLNDDDGGVRYVPDPKLRMLLSVDVEPRSVFFRSKTDLFIRNIMNRLSAFLEGLDCSTGKIVSGD